MTTLGPFFGLGVGGLGRGGGVEALVLLSALVGMVSFSLIHHIM